MEVHAHSHTERKKWTHYLWEFLMLFLAVTLGFLVENQREHYIEHQRAESYAANMYQELKKDTLELDSLIGQVRDFCKKLDTFCLIREAKDLHTNGMLYYYSNYTTTGSTFSPNNSTLEQLKNSGNLRYLKKEVANKISEYDKFLQDLDKELTTARSEYNKINELRLQIFDGLVADNFYSTGVRRPRDSMLSLNPPLINDEPRLMKEFTGWVKYTSGVYREQVWTHFRPLKKRATELMELLKKEYHLK
jgi:hypothetical protein